MKNGAVDFLSKPFDDEQLLNAVSEAIQRSEQISKAQTLKKQIQQKLDNLTSRENEVLKYLITGMLNKQIAYELNISERTTSLPSNEASNTVPLSIPSVPLAK